MDKINLYNSTGYVLLIGYAFTFSLGVTFIGMHTLHQHSSDEHLMIAVLFTALVNGMCLLSCCWATLEELHIMVPKAFSLCWKFFRGITKLITIDNISLNNRINMVIIFPFLFGSISWYLHLKNVWCNNKASVQSFMVCVIFFYCSSLAYWKHLFRSNDSCCPVFLVLCLSYYICGLIIS
jgi:hypothetical protein